MVESVSVKDVSCSMKEENTTVMLIDISTIDLKEVNIDG